MTCKALGSVLNIVTKIITTRLKTVSCRLVGVMGQRGWRTGRNIGFSHCTLVSTVHHSDLISLLKL